MCAIRVRVLRFAYRSLDGQLRETEKQDIADRFNELHERLRGHAAQEEPVEIVSYRVRAEVAVPQFIPAPAGEAPSIKPAQEAKVSERQVSFKRGEVWFPRAYGDGKYCVMATDWWDRRSWSNSTPPR